MLDRDLEVGDLVFTKSLAAVHTAGKSSLTMTYRTDKKTGKLFALMLIGVEDPKTFGVLEAKARMKELGWVEKIRPE
jgi:hypothetical protein